MEKGPALREAIREATPGTCWSDPCRGQGGRAFPWGTKAPVGRWMASRQDRKEAMADGAERVGCSREEAGGGQGP